MSYQNRSVIFGTHHCILEGHKLSIGDKAPDFGGIDDSLEEVRLSAMPAKVRIIASVPSLETGVCDRETRRFNQEAGALGNDVEILVVSMDLPFDQKRWCGAAGVDQVKLLSDHRTGEFGEAYGVLIKQLRLLARAVFVTDRESVIHYIEVLEESGKEPDYEAALVAVKKLLL